MEKKKLFSDFAPVSKQQWLDKIQVDLKGADFNKRLVWRTNEGFQVQPFYQREDVKDLPTLNALPGQYPYVRGNNTDENTWFVRQNIEVGGCVANEQDTDSKATDPVKAANEKALDILNRGVDSLGFHIPGRMVSAETVETLLDGIYAEAIELNFTTCPRHALELAQILKAYFEKKGYKPEALNGSLNFDPLEKMLSKGKDTSFLLPQLKDIVLTLKDYPNFRTIGVDALTLTNDGAFSYQELGYALSWGNEYMQQLTDQGVPADLAAENIKFNFGIGGVYFMEIAKFRAARMLWAHIVSQYTDNKEAAKMHICATTTSYNMTLFDSYVNMLRSQTETMSAALAGVESIVVTPFDVPYEIPTDFAERIARNQQLLLKEECHFNKIVDVAGGSYFVEHLTQALSEQAWKLFLEVEDKGGFLSEAKQGLIQQAITETNQKRHQNAGKRREFILGTNQFPNFTEKSDGKRPIEQCCCSGKGSGQSANGDNNAANSDIPAIQSSRLASDFEALRLKTEQAEKVPLAFMLTIGNLAMRQARAQFSCNFLASAGYQVKDNLGFETVEQGAKAAREAGADIVVLCSSDDEYADYGVPAFQAVKEAYADAGRQPLFVIAGAPACSDDLKAAGIENFIHVRVDQLQTLKEFNQKLGI